MKKIGTKIEILNLNTKKEKNNGYLITIFSNSGKKELQALSVKNLERFNCNLQNTWLHIIVDKDNNRLFFLESEAHGCIYQLDEAQNAEQYKYTADGVFYYQKNGLWYILGTEIILLGKEILPYIFIKKSEDNSYIVTHSRLETNTFKCKSYKITKASNGDEYLLLGDVTNKREYFIILSSQEVIHSFVQLYIELIIDDKNVLFNDEENYWITTDRKVPEELYQFEQD